MKKEIRYFLYTLIVITCIVAIGIAVYAQVFYKDASEDKLMLSPNQNKVAEQEERLAQVKENFNDMFNNALIYVVNPSINRATRYDMSKDLVYTVNQLSKTEIGKYEMDVKVPALNIVSTLADQINNEIQSIFVAKASSLLSTTPAMYTIYNIDYASFVNDNIISIVIRATLKEGNNPQRAIFMTYNYNMNTDSLVTLNDILQLRGIKQDTLQTRINNEINETSQKTEDLKNIGYTVYTRNPNDSMYKVENTSLYFMGNNSYIYILYAYGNSNNTSEVDVIVV